MWEKEGSWSKRLGKKYKITELAEEDEKMEQEMDLKQKKKWSVTLSYGSSEARKGVDQKHGMKWERWYVLWCNKGAKCFLEYMLLRNGERSYRCVPEV